MEKRAIGDIRILIQKSPTHVNAVVKNFLCQKGF